MQEEQRIRVIRKILKCFRKEWQINLKGGFREESYIPPLLKTAPIHDFNADISNEMVKRPQIYPIFL